MFFRFSSVWAELFDLYPPPKHVVFDHLRIPVHVDGYTFCSVNIEQIRVYAQKLPAKSLLFCSDFFWIVNCEGFMGICVENLDIYCGFRKRSVFTVVPKNATLFRCIKLELLEIYEGNPNTRGKMGGHKIVTSTSTYVHMGRFRPIPLHFYERNLMYKS